jgi:hypothetical protein
MSERYSASYFDIQIAFAKHVSEVTELPFEEVLAIYTTISKCGIDWQDLACDHGNPLWCEFVDGLRNCSEKSEFIHDFYLRHMKSVGSDQHGYFGCFSYRFPSHGKNKVAIHFHGERHGGPGVLSKANVGARKNELRQMFEDVRRRHPQAERVRGNSWMHNIEAYRRVFPPSYYAGAKTVPIVDELRFVAIWGQFVDVGWKVKESIAEEFLECLKKQTSFDSCLSCFRYGTVNPECAIEIFYDFYGIG